MASLKDGSRDQAERHYERILNDRIEFETREVNRLGPHADGADHKGVMQTHLNGKLLHAYHWELWKYKLTLMVILPNQYPLVPPLVRVIDNFDRGPWHEDFDGDTGFVRRQFGDDQPWSPAITVWSVFMATMDIINRAGLLEYPRPIEKPHVRGDFRPKMILTYGEFHCLISPFGQDFLSSLDTKYTIRHEVRCAKTGPERKRRHIQIYADTDGIYPDVEAEIRAYITSRMAKLRDAPVDMHVSSKSSELEKPEACASETGQVQKAKKCTSSESGKTLDEMKGVKGASSMVDMPRRGAGRGRGRWTPMSVPGRSIYTSIPPSTEATNLNPGITGDVIARADHFSQNEATVPSDIDGLKQLTVMLFRRMEERCVLQLEHTIMPRVEELSRRLEAMEGTLATFLLITGEIVVERRKMIATETRFRNAWMCSKCKHQDKENLIPDKRMLILECCHLYCEHCARGIMACGWCLCGRTITDCITVYP